MSLDLEYAIKQDIRNNPVVREVDARERREFLSTVGVAVLIVAMLLFAAWQHYRIVSTGIEVEALRLELGRELELNRQLRLDLETLRRPQEIERRAAQDLGMRPAAPEHTIVIERAPRAASGSRSVVAAHR